VFDTYNAKMQLSMLVRIQLFGESPRNGESGIHIILLKYQIYLKTKIVRR
jgi:hypothetical protein